MTAIDRSMVRSGLADNRPKNNINVMQNVMAIFIMLVFLGFPGTLSTVVGGAVCSLIEYASFGLQFVVVLLGSGDDVMSIKLLSLHPAYWAQYLFVFYATADSLVVSVDKKTVIITLVHLILTLLFALWMVEQYSLEDLLEVFYYAQFMYIAICVIGMVIFPKAVFYSYHGSRTFRGLLRTKNEAGTELSFGILVQCVLLRLRMRKGQKVSILFLGILALQFGLTLFTKAMGALLITFGFIGYMVFYSIQKKKRRIPLGLMFIVVTVGFLFFALTILQALSPFLESMGKDASLTGRVPVWNQILKVMQESHTMTGYGMEMFWKTPSSLKAFRAGFDEHSWAATTASNSHNTIMETWCNLGLIGLTLYYFMFLFADKGIKRLDEDGYLFCSAYMVMFTVRALTERQTAPASIYVLISYVVLALIYKTDFDYKRKSKRKARIYENKQEDTQTGAMNQTLDWTAFQARFSNISDERQDKRPRYVPTPIDGQEEEEEEEAANQLEKLLKEFDDDDS